MSQNLTCVRVGDGQVARLHEKKLRALGIETVGIIDPDPVKQKEAAQRGIKVCSFDQAAELKPFFWDICCPTQHHLETIRTIVECDNTANIIVEKPVCEYGQIKSLIMSKSLRNAIEYFQEKRENPCPAKLAMEIVTFFNLWYKQKSQLLAA